MSSWIFYFSRSHILLFKSSTGNSLSVYASTAASLNTANLSTAAVAPLASPFYTRVSSVSYSAANSSAASGSRCFGSSVACYAGFWLPSLSVIVRIFPVVPGRSFCFLPVC